MIDPTTAPVGQSPAADPWPSIPDGADPNVVRLAQQRATQRFADALEQLVTELPDDATLDDLKAEALRIAQASRLAYADLTPPESDPDTPVTPPAADDREGYLVTGSGARCVPCGDLASTNPMVGPAAIMTPDTAAVEAWMTEHTPVCPGRHPELVPAWPPVWSE